MASLIEKSIRSAVTAAVTGLAALNRKRLHPPVAGHPYLTGIHRPMREELTLTVLEVEGEIPREFDGRYLRIGPNPMTPPDPASYHWFIGDGMAHGVRIRDGRALWYRNRWVRSNAVSDALGEPRKPGPRDPRADTANTNITAIGGRTFALVEAGAKPVEMSEELETIAHNPFDGTLQGPFSAHPHFDPQAREWHAICYDAQVHDKVWHTVVDEHAKVIREEPVAVSQGPSIHDCAITERFVLVFDLPAVFSMKRLIAGYAFPYEWNPSHGARVGLLAREGSAEEIVWCQLDEPCYVYHPANAFDLEDGRVVVDVVVHESTYAASPHGPGGAWSRFERWTLDPAHRRVDRQIIDDRPQEFPRYDERRTCRPYRYAYTIGMGQSDAGTIEIGRQLFKHDLESGTTQSRDMGAGRYPGEFVFIPRSADSPEDDGWLMGLVIDAASERTELQILNAADFTGTPQAVIAIPHRIPPGFHGNWIPAVG